MDMLTRGVDRAALQQSQGTIVADLRPHPKWLWSEQPFRALESDSILRMTPTPPRQFFIQGRTLNGKTFRPSDWAERLAGAMSSFRPEGTVRGIGAHIGYSPYCVPNTIDGVKYVIVSEALRGIEPMAWDFVMNFARDNNLQCTEACLLPDLPA
jgi:hypothetical protein